MRWVVLLCFSSCADYEVMGVEVYGDPCPARSDVAPIIHRAAKWNARIKPLLCNTILTFDPDPIQCAEGLCAGTYSYDGQSVMRIYWDGEQAMVDTALAHELGHEMAVALYDNDDAAHARGEIWGEFVDYVSAAMTSRPAQ